MASEDLQVRCPCCGAQLLVDRQSGQVTAAGERPRPKDLSEVVQRVQERSGKAAGDFTAALDAERRRKQELEELFRKAQDKARKEGPPTERPESPLDDRWR